MHVRGQGKQPRRSGRAHGQCASHVLAASALIVQHSLWGGATSAERTSSVDVFVGRPPSALHARPRRPLGLATQATHFSREVFPRLRQVYLASLWMFASAVGLGRAEEKPLDQLSCVFWFFSLFMQVLGPSLLVLFVLCDGPEEIWIFVATTSSGPSL